MNLKKYNEAIEIAKNNQVTKLRETDRSITWLVKDKYRVTWQIGKPMWCDCQAEMFDVMCKHKLATLFFYYNNNNPHIE